jgi:hypothetical protein
MIKLPLPVATFPLANLAQCCADEICDELAHSDALRDAVAPRLRPAIEKRIASYLAHGGDPTLLGVTPFPRAPSKTPPTDGNHLYARYHSGHSTDSGIVKAVVPEGPKYCPYCGLYMDWKPHGRSPDRDHILPRSAFPEFTLFRVNLVATCDACNDEKNDKYLDENGDWLYVHPYLDDFLASTLIRVEFSQIENVVVPRFEVAPNCPPAARARVQRHIKDLDLFQRYGHGVLREFVGLVEVSTLTAQPDERGSIVPAVRGALRKISAARLAERANDPLALLLSAFAADPELPTYLKLAVQHAPPTTQSQPP